MCKMTYREAIKTVMLGLGYQVSSNADIYLMQLRRFVGFFFSTREGLLLPFGWGSGSR